MCIIVHVNEKKIVSRERLRLRSVVVYKRASGRERGNFQNSPTSIRNKQTRTNHRLLNVPILKPRLLASSLFEPRNSSTSFY